MNRRHLIVAVAGLALASFNFLRFTHNPIPVLAPALQQPEVFIQLSMQTSKLSLTRRSFAFKKWIRSQAASPAKPEADLGQPSMEIVVPSVTRSQPSEEAPQAWLVRRTRFPIRR